MAATILAVDDSASMRQMVSFTLKHAGYIVVQAVDGVEALEYARSNSVNLVLTDVNMPRMDGIPWCVSCDNWMTTNSCRCWC